MTAYAVTDGGDIPVEVQGCPFFATIMELRPPTQSLKDIPRDELPGPTTVFVGDREGVKELVIGLVDAMFDHYEQSGQ